MASIHSKFTLLFLFLLISHMLMWGQERKTVLSAPGNWNSEIIPFPLSFAPDIEFEGFEDIRFAPGWTDAASKEFWTYHFTWVLNQEINVTEKSLADIFQVYYDGLSLAVLKEQNDSIDANMLDKTLCLFIETEDGFTGKLRIFDSFFTKEYLILFVKARESFCEKTNQHLVSFDISPKSFEDEIWRIFQEVEV
ncbi:MAG: hypothetical protein AAF655_27610, partial [Bacteroidota bacterium]